MLESLCLSSVATTCGREVIFRGTFKCEGLTEMREVLDSGTSWKIWCNITTAKVYVIGGFQCSCFCSSDIDSLWVKAFSAFLSKKLAFRMPCLNLHMHTFMVLLIFKNKETLFRRSLASDLEISNKRGRFSVNFSFAIALFLRFCLDANLFWYSC